MSNIYEHALYKEDISAAAGQNLPWEKLSNKRVFITGARGLIGSFLVDVIMKKNLEDSLNCSVTVVGRSQTDLFRRFACYAKRKDFEVFVHDINSDVDIDYNKNVDFILHLASNTHPVAYATDPIGTIKANVIGLNKLLEFAVKKKAERFVFASSNEIYGENRGDTELFSESYCGYIDSNTLRAGYPESKRCGEALCQAYMSQKSLDIVISRFTRSYGPTMLGSDSKAISQFIKKAINKENIILKSKGEQYYSYTYMADAVIGFLFVWLCGDAGEAYNIADQQSDIKLKDLAKLLADLSGTRVEFRLPNEVEAKGFSKATVARLDASKLKEKGWTPVYDIKQGLQRTLEIIRENI